MLYSSSWILSTHFTTQIPFAVTKANRELQIVKYLSGATKKYSLSLLEQGLTGGKAAKQMFYSN
jgi:hypothetical protein